ncbi:glutamyl-tRNA synthetase [Desulfonispora thiosulfatigenes DSM 11270]|uniref:Glutamate--tRNA ligase n=1 Tax=Desulfonispora thiosulfatigenes DSM 11270 TaxID=656914 RepID=A0A1W1UTS3_DESTI|nr:glutamate--tRNA ligase [Desulfonispora thiosulfatigenes]SMB84446.1 glutamyl-tRNA synthetase [Desulfonispora thiosulfatigenes DSM 11270]
MEDVRLRFAPSPTGPLHIGGARSALFNFLLARKLGGKLILRIEDTDRERSSRESEVNIYESLKWLGIDWDEGPDMPGEYGPYRQTERLEIYQKYIDSLIEKGHAYYCYCSEEEIEEQRKEFSAKGELPRYNGTCRNLTEEKRNQFIKEGRKPVVRFKVPENQMVTIDDMVRGTVNFETNGIGDYVIVKSDGIPTYNFAVVVDDYTMKISHIVRAEEHLSNTPRQILVYNALGFETPKFAHVSLILGSDRTKMSKRHGATSVVQYMEKGYLPEAVVNFLALLGWSPGGEEEIFTVEEIIERFSLDHVSKRPAVFDMDKLDWINGTYIRKTDLDKLTKLTIPFLQRSGYLEENVDEANYTWVKNIVACVQEKIHSLNEIPEYMELFVGKEVTFESDEVKDILKEEQVPELIEAFKAKINDMEELEASEIKKALKAIAKETGIKGKKLFMPLRVAVTGRTHGPEIDMLITVLGKELLAERLDFTLNA